MYPPSTSSDSEGNDGLQYIFIDKQHFVGIYD